MILPNSGLEIPFDQLIPSISLVISAAAALAGFLVLWFTAVKGPDIDLVPLQLSLPRPDTDPDYPFDTIRLSPVEMVFTNNGSKAGAVTDVRADFKPSNTFRRFHEELGQRAEVKSPVSEFKVLPAVVPERGTSIVTLDLWIVLKPWKDLSRLADLGDKSLGEALKLIWKEGKSALADLSNLSDTVGTVEIRAKRTRRHRLRIKLLEDVVAPGLKLGSVPEWARSQAKVSLSSFHKLRKSDAEIARDIRHIPEFFMGDYHQNVSILLPSNIGEMKQLQTSGWTQVLAWGRWDKNPMRYVLDHEKTFKAKMETYYTEVNKYNESILAVAPERSVDAPEMQWLVRLRADLLARTHEFYRELLQLREKLSIETEHLVPLKEEGSTLNKIEEKPLEA